MAKRRKWIAAVASAVLMTGLLDTPARAGGRHGGGGGHSDGGGVTIVASGLNGPRQITAQGEGSRLYVAESDSGQVSLVNTRTGSVTPVATGLGENLVQGVAVVRNRLMIAIGAGEPEETDAPPPAPFGIAKLLSVKGDQSPTQLADLGKFELDNNPDGQPQFDAAGKPLDAWSNPYFVLADRNGAALIADAGGNDILRRTAKGVLSVWKVLPLITDGSCAGQPNNVPEIIGCDPVPTGLARGRHGEVYVSTAGALHPGAARVYVFDRRHDHPVRVIDGLSGATGVAVDDDGNVYVSEMLEGAPEGEGPPPAGFDLAGVGQIVKIAPDESRTYAQVTMPAGLLIHRGNLYASAWAVAGLFAGIPDRGEIVRVDPSAFGAAPPAAPAA